MEDKLKEFILKNPELNSLLQKYTFQYREFSDIEDYCELKWNKNVKEWELLGYYCHNIKEELPSQKENAFYLNLSINEYNWGSLFNEMERRFNEMLNETMNDEEVDEFIDKNYKEYDKMRDEFFNNSKNSIIEAWFVLTEDSIFEYLHRQLLRLREAVLIKKIIVF